MTGRVPSSLILHQSTMPKGRSSLLPFLATPTNTQKTPNKQGLFDFLPRIKTSLEWDGVDGCDPVTPPPPSHPIFLRRKVQGRSFYDGKKGVLYYHLTVISSSHLVVGRAESFCRFMCHDRVPSPWAAENTLPLP